MSQPADDTQMPEHTSPVEKDTVTKTAIGKALSTLGLGGLGEQLESVVIVPGTDDQPAMVIAHTRNDDGSTTTKQLPVS